VLLHKSILQVRSDVAAAVVLSSIFKKLDGQMWLDWFSLEQ